MPGWKTIHVSVGDSEYVSPWSAKEGGPKLWNSQVKQDETIADIFGGKKNGFFVDLAANDAIFISNTYSLETNLDWSGICIEANAMYMWGLAHRNCEVVWGVTYNTTGDSVAFTYNGYDGGIVSAETDIKQKRPELTTETLPTIALRDILVKLNAPKVIDYFSFDIEGAEQIVLQYFPFDEYTFLTMTVERPNPELVKKLESHGYIYVKDHGTFGDKLYVHKTLPNLQQVLARHG